MIKKYNFLDNKPSGKDLFEGQSQNRIADVLVDVIENDKFKVIGIDGGWGTGKSNLVQIVDDKLPKHKFFLYDVWGVLSHLLNKNLKIQLFLNSTRPMT